MNQNNTHPRSRKDAMLRNHAMIRSDAMLRIGPLRAHLCAGLPRAGLPRSNPRSVGLP
jgi:hypothetical protein